MVQSGVVTLNEIERVELAQYEETIQRGIGTFVEVGQALLAIRDQRLYRAEFGTFEDYCRERWGFSDRHARRLIDASSTIINIESGPTGSGLPVTEREIRPLTKLEPDQQREAWQRAVETAPDGKITAGHVQRVVDEMTRPATPEAAGHIVQDGNVIRVENRAPLSQSEIDFFHEMNLDKQLEEETANGESATADEWANMPDEFVGHCFKGCYSPQTMRKGAPERFGYRGVYVCQGCGYAYPPVLTADAIPYYEPETEDEEPEEQAPRLAVHFSSATPEHYTPREIIDAALACMGAIDLDPCSNSHESPNVPATEHFTIDDDGLAQEWHGRVYMNPPYGRDIVAWVEKLDTEHRAGRAIEALALVPARTDTQWWQTLRDYPVCFITGRLKFINEGNGESAPFPSAVIYLGTNIDHFYYAFNDLGDIYQRIEPGMFASD